MLQKTSIYAIAVVVAIKFVNLYFFITEFSAVNPTGIAKISLLSSGINYFIWFYSLLGLLSWVPLIIVYRKLPVPQTLIENIFMFILYSIVWYIFLTALMVWAVMLFFSWAIF